MNSKTRKITLTSIFTALICVTTLLVKVPTPSVNGYIHLGDGFVILSGIILGPLGAVSAAVGSALADFFGGYLLYMPITFLIKGLVSLMSAVIFKGLKKTINSRLLRCLLCGLVSTVIVVLGYFLFEFCIYGKAAILNIPLNLIQGCSGVIISCFSLGIIEKMKI